MTCPLLKQKVNSQLRFLGTSWTPFLEPEPRVLCIGSEAASLSRKPGAVSRRPPRSLQGPLWDLQPRLLSPRNLGAAKQASPIPRLDFGFPCGQTVLGIVFPCGGLFVSFLSPWLPGEGLEALTQVPDWNKNMGEATLVSSHFPAYNFKFAGIFFFIEGKVRSL